MITFNEFYDSCDMSCGSGVGSYVYGFSNSSSLSSGVDFLCVVARLLRVCHAFGALISKPRQATTSKLALHIAS